MRTIIVLFLLFSFVASAQMEVETFPYFTILHDSIGTHKGAYRLTDKMVERDSSIDRQKHGSFTRFRKFVTDDYKNTGFQRGHLAPADHFSFSLDAYRDTYSLANIIPQEGILNMNAWKHVEFYEKRLATKLGCIYVVIKVNYSEKKIGDLTIPKTINKYIYDCFCEFIEAHEFHNL